MKSAMHFVVWVAVPPLMYLLFVGSASWATFTKVLLGGAIIGAVVVWVEEEVRAGRQEGLPTSPSGQGTPSGGGQEAKGTSHVGRKNEVEQDLKMLPEDAFRAKYNVSQDFYAQLRVWLAAGAPLPDLKSVSEGPKTG